MSAALAQFFCRRAAGRRSGPGRRPWPALGGRAGWAGRPAQAFVAVVAVWGLALAVSRRGLSLGLFLLGATLFLFGWQAYVYPSARLRPDPGHGRPVPGLWRNLGQGDSRDRSRLRGRPLRRVSRRAGRPGPGVHAAFALGPPGAQLAFFGPTAFFAAVAFSRRRPGLRPGAAARLAVFAGLPRTLARTPGPGASKPWLRASWPAWSSPSSTAWPCISG